MGEPAGAMVPLKSGKKKKKKSAVEKKIVYWSPIRINKPQSPPPQD
jgi:hypothetical protein